MIAYTSQYSLLNESHLFFFKNLYPHRFSAKSQTLLVCFGIPISKFLNFITLLVINILFTPWYKVNRHVLLTHVLCATFKPCGWYLNNTFLFKCVNFF